MKRSEISLIKEQIDMQSVSEIQIKYISRGGKSKISSSDDAYDKFWHWWDMDNISLIEIFVMLLMNRAHRVIGMFRVSTGGLSGTVVDVRLMCAVAIVSGSSAVILGHNHPSGNIRPSDADIRITNKCQQALQMMDIYLLDHIILTPEHGSYLSFQDEGLIDTGHYEP